MQRVSRFALGDYFQTEATGDSPSTIICVTLPSIGWWGLLHITIVQLGVGPYQWCITSAQQQQQPLVSTSRTLRGFPCLSHPCNVNVPMIIVKLWGRVWYWWHDAMMMTLTTMMAVFMMTIQFSSITSSAQAFLNCPMQCYTKQNKNTVHYADVCISWDFHVYYQFCRIFPNLTGTAGFAWNSFRISWDLIRGL